MASQESLLRYDWQFADFNGDRKTDLFSVDILTGNVEISITTDISTTELLIQLSPEWGWRAIL
jgi:hypothetical protein